MLSTRRTWLGVLSILLFGFSSAWAGSTLHIGPGAGTPCAMGCGGDPNFFTSPLPKIDIFQNSGGAPALQGPVLLIAGVPIQWASHLPTMPISWINAINPYPGGVQTPGTFDFALGGTFGLKDPISAGYFGTMTAGQEVYSFLGLPGANNSNSFTNWAGFIYDTLGWTIAGFDIHVYALEADFADKGLIDIKLLQKPGFPKLTYFVAYGQAPDGTPYSTPFTECGLKVCKTFPNP